MNVSSEEPHSQIAKDVCSRYPDKIVYTEHPGQINRGVSISRNEASKLARGKYLAFLDADDVWLPNKLTEQLQLFAFHPQVQVVFGAFMIWQSWNDRKAGDFVYQIGVPAGCYSPRILNKFLYPFQTGTTPAPSGILITKQAFDDVGRFEPSFSGIHELYEDQAFLSEVFLHLSVFVSAESHLMYRRREGSMSSAARSPERYHTVKVFYCNWLENYLRSQSVHDAVLNGLVQDLRQASLLKLEEM